MFFWHERGGIRSLADPRTLGAIRKGRNSYSDVRAFPNLFHPLNVPCWNSKPFRFQKGGGVFQRFRESSYSLRLDLKQFVGRSWSVV